MHHFKQVCGPLFLAGIAVGRLLSMQTVPLQTLKKQIPSSTPSPTTPNSCRVGIPQNLTCIIRNRCVYINMYIYIHGLNIYLGPKLQNVIGCSYYAYSDRFDIHRERRDVAKL